MNLLFAELSNQVNDALVNRLPGAENCLAQELLSIDASEWVSKAAGQRQAGWSGTNNEDGG